jgi:hypothetical protein
MLLLYLTQPEYAPIADEEMYYFPQESGQFPAGEYILSASNRYEFRATETPSGVVYRAEPARR